MIKKEIKNKQIIDFSIHEHTLCVLSLSGGYSISIECLVRFIGINKIFICAADHGHKFGLESAYNAEEKIREVIINQEITNIKFDQDTGDLSLLLNAGVFQIICNSSGYENYQINGPNNIETVIYGGRQNEIT